LFSKREQEVFRKQLPVRGDGMPGTTKFGTIEGGNHAEFGDYGTQRKDGEAMISRVDQQNYFAETTAKFLLK